MRNQRSTFQNKQKHLLDTTEQLSSKTKPRQHLTPGRSELLTKLLSGGVEGHVSAHSGVRGVDWRLHRKQLLIGWSSSGRQWSCCQETSCTKTPDGEVPTRWRRWYRVLFMRRCVNSPKLQNAISVLNKWKANTFPRCILNCKFWEIKLAGSSSAALWIIKRHVESWIWRAAAGWIHASSQLTRERVGTVFRLDDDQTRQGENTRKQEEGPALEIRQKLQRGEEMDVMLICLHVAYVCWWQDQFNPAQQVVYHSSMSQPERRKYLTSWGKLRQMTQSDETSGWI